MDQEINLSVSEYVRTGITRIPKWKLYQAYDAERLRENVWRDIKERVVDQGGAWTDVQVFETYGDIVLVNEKAGKPLRERI